MEGGTEGGIEGGGSAAASESLDVLPLSLPPSQPGPPSLPPSQPGPPCKNTTGFPCGFPLSSQYSVWTAETGSMPVLGREGGREGGRVRTVEIGFSSLLVVQKQKGKSEREGGREGGRAYRDACKGG